MDGPRLPFLGGRKAGALSEIMQLGGRGGVLVGGQWGEARCSGRHQQWRSPSRQQGCPPTAQGCSNRPTRAGSLTSRRLSACGTCS